MHQILSDEEVVHIRGRYSSPEHKRGNALSFEIENVCTEVMALCVVNVLLELSIYQVVVWVASPWHPVVARIPVRGDLIAILEEAALSEDVVSLASEHVIGRAAIGLPLSGEPGDFFCSGTGPFEEAVKRIAQLCPGGVLFRGN